MSANLSMHAVRGRLKGKLQLLILGGLLALGAGGLEGAVPVAPKPLGVDVNTTWFEPNRGQGPGFASFISRSPGAVAWLASDRIALTLSGGEGRDEAFSIYFPGHERLEWKGSRRLDTRVNYFLRDQAEGWITNLPTFSEVQAEAYPGVTLKVLTGPEFLRYDFLLEPGASPEDMLIRFSGLRKVELTKAGTLRLVTREGKELIQRRPRAFQHGEAGRVEVPVRYALLDAHAVRLEVPSYDPQLPLLIDPTISYATYLGGQARDSVHGLAVDSMGHAFLVGESSSPDFAGSDSNVAAGRNAYVAKMNPTGTALEFVTFLGGFGDDYGNAIALGPDGSVVIGGRSNSNDFPTTAFAFQKISRGGFEGFIARVSGNGDELIFSSLMGGTSNDSVQGLAVQSDGLIVVVGTTSSPNFPVVGDVFQPGVASPTDAFVSKISASASEILYSSRLGGEGFDEARGVVVDAAGNAYVVGRTISSQFPVKDPLQEEIAGKSDGFITKVNPDGRELVYSTFLGGTGEDTLKAAVLDRFRNLAFVGSTDSGDFPFVRALQGATAGKLDAFLGQIDSQGSNLLLASPFGGAEDDRGLAIAMDSNGDLYFAGSTESGNLRLREPFQDRKQGGSDAFLLKVNGQDFRMAYASYYGGAGNDSGEGLALDASSNVYLAGSTASGDLTLLNPFQSEAKGAENGFLIKVVEESHLYFAQFGDGGGAANSIRSQIQVVNLDRNLSARVTVRINRSDGGPMTVDLNGEIVVGEKSFLVSPGGILTLTTDGDGPLQVGSVQVSADAAISGVILFRSSNSVAGVGATLRPLRQAVAPIQAGGGVDAGVAAMNLGREQDIMLELFNQQGIHVASALEALPEDGHFAKLITEFDWDAPVDFSAFVGTVLVSGEADFSAMVILVTPEGFATQPVTPVEE